MEPISLEDLRAAEQLVRRAMPATPAFAWPLLAERFGLDVVVKHENHTPTGAFKVRGGLVYMDRLVRERPHVRGIVSATRGNHGQSLAFAARKAGLEAIIVVPHGNSVEKNAAMRAFGATLVEHGRDFDEARDHAVALAKERGYEFAASFQRDLVLGVATYALELFEAHGDFDTVYAPIGMGSGICGLITVRDLLGLETKLVGIVAENAPAYALSFDAGKPVNTNSADTLADGVACRAPDAQAVEIICEGAERIVRIEEDEFLDAMAAYFVDTHNAAEGAAGGPLAGLLKEREKMAGKKVGLIMSGGNSDREMFRDVLARAIA